MSYGLTDQGFVRKTLLDVVSDLEAALRSAFGNNIKLDTKSVFGKLVGAFSQPLADVWELAEAVYNAMYPTTATTIAGLDGGVELIGITRNAGVASVVQEVLEGSVGTVIALESKIETENVGDQFQTKAEITLSASVAVRSNTSLIGSVTNGKVYTITINGTDFTYTATVPPDDADAVSAGLEAAINGGSEPVTATDLTGGYVQVDGDDDTEGLPTPFTVAVNANVRLDTVGNLQECESVEAGPIQAFADTLNQIVNPISGWTAAWNPLDATLGEIEETQAALRARRAQSLAAPGAGTPEAMLAGLLAIDAVTSAIVMENTGDVTDALGLPPHSMECVVEGGDEDDIGAVLWARKGGGIALHGDESVTVEDSQGYDHVLEYSRPGEVLQWLKATYHKYDEENFPQNGETTMAATLLATGNAHGVGNDVMPDRFKGPVFDAVAGIETLLIEIADDVAGSPGPYTENVKSIEFNEIAKFDSARISIVEV
jgi:uncharacterized phage protein gp47/JayE